MYIQKEKVELEHLSLLGKQGGHDYIRREEDLRERTAELLMRKVEVHTDLNLRTEMAINKRREALEAMPDGEAKDAEEADILREEEVPILACLIRTGRVTLLCGMSQRLQKAEAEIASHKSALREMGGVSHSGQVLDMLQESLAEKAP